MSTNRHTETIEVVKTDQRCRRWSVAEKAELVRRTYEPGMTVSLVARQSELDHARYEAHDHLRQLQVRPDAAVVTAWCALRAVEETRPLLPGKTGLRLLPVR